MEPSLILLAFASVLFLLIFGHDFYALYICRVSLLASFALWSFPLLAFTRARPLLFGVFDLDTTTEGLEVGILLFFASWAVITTSEMVAVLAPMRMRVTFQGRRKFFFIARAILILLGIVINCAVIVSATDGPKLEVAGGLVLGLTAGVTVFVVIQIVKAAPHINFSRPFPIPLLVWRQMLYPSVVMPVEEPPKEGFFLKPGGNTVFVPGWLGRGYLYRTKNGTAGLLPGHMEATFVLFLTAFVYVLFLLQSDPIPSLCWLLLSLILFIWLFSALAFFFDSYRIPVFLPLILWVYLSSGISTSDHFYRIWKAREVDNQATSPGDLIARAADDGKPVILIAAAGGGIQSAAWTARVLTGLEEVLDGNEQGAFARSIRLFSGVSGGSTGVMFYVHATYPLVPLSSSRSKKQIKSFRSPKRQASIRSSAVWYL